MNRLLNPVIRADKVKGPTNPHSTSCFMNAVLLAMFLPYIPVFDRLFLQGTTNPLKQAVRTFVLHTRYGIAKFNSEHIRTLLGIAHGQQDAVHFLTSLWSAVDPRDNYSISGDISYSTDNADSPSLTPSQVRNLFYNSDIDRVNIQKNSKIVTVNIADAPSRALVKFTDLTQPPQPALVDNDTYRFYHGTTYRVDEISYEQWLEGKVIPDNVLLKIISVTLPSFIVYERERNMTQALFTQLYAKIRTNIYFFYSLRAIAIRVGSNIEVPEGYSWTDRLSSWTIPDGGLPLLNEHLINKYLESLYLLGYGGSATRLYQTLGSSVGSFVYSERHMLKDIASTVTWARPLQSGKILRTTSPIIKFNKDVFVISIARHYGTTRMHTRFCPVDNCNPWKKDETFVLTVPKVNRFTRLKLSSVIINTSEASKTFETYGHYTCYVLVQDVWYAYDDLVPGGLKKTKMSKMQHDMETMGSIYFYVTEEHYIARPKSGWSHDNESAAYKLLNRRPFRPSQPPPPPPSSPSRPTMVIAPAIPKKQKRKRKPLPPPTPAPAYVPTPPTYPTSHVPAPSTPPIPTPPMSPMLSPSSIISSPPPSPV